jgi:hypothetical protein
MALMSCAWAAAGAFDGAWAGASMGAAAKPAARTAMAMVLRFTVFSLKKASAIDKFSSSA